jgi:SAM-dependent methyltransferase
LRTKIYPHDLDKIAALTLGHYNQSAEDFRDGTRDHDVSQNIDALLRHIEGEPPFTILDFGCGPGRDLRVLAGLGHIAVGLDGAARFIAMARADTGCDVWQQDFLKLDLPGGTLMVCSPTPRCFMSRARSCRECCGNCMPR